MIQKRILFISAICFLLAFSTIVGAAEFGIAAKYAEDKNLQYDPDVLFAWDYESGEDFRFGWARGINYYKLTTNAGEVFQGKTSIRADLVQGTHGYPADYILLPKPETCLYQRWYCKLESGFEFGPTGLKTHGFGGYGPGESPNTPLGSAGIPPNGRDKIFVIVYPTVDHRTGVYFYHMDQPDGWGDGGTYGPTIQTGQWYCYELMVKLNTVGQANGELKCWINGNLQFSRTGLRFRSINELGLNMICDLVYNPIPKNEAIWFDNRAIARKYIGPSSGNGPNSPPIPTNPPPVPPDTQVPTISGLFPAANATGVATKTLITFHIKDDRGVDTTSLVLRVNGQAGKPKMTGYLRDISATYPALAAYPSGAVIPVTIDVKDLWGNSMPTFKCSFTTAGTPGIMVRPRINSLMNSQIREFDLLGREFQVRNTENAARAISAYIVSKKSRTQRVITVK